MLSALSRMNYVRIKVNILRIQNIIVYACACGRQSVEHFHLTKVRLMKDYVFSSFCDLISLTPTIIDPSFNDIIKMTPATTR